MVMEQLLYKHGVMIFFLKKHVLAMPKSMCMLGRSYYASSYIHCGLSFKDKRGGGPKRRRGIKAGCYHSVKFISKVYMALNFFQDF